jgi:DNA repair protein RadC
VSSSLSASALKIACPQSARQFFSPWFAWKADDSEMLCAVHVDEAGQCLRLTQYHGDRFHVCFPIKQIVADIIECGSAGIIIAHNHPSGDATPSESDCRATRCLAAVSEALDCVVHDHLVFAKLGSISFKQSGLL